MEAARSAILVEFELGRSQSLVLERDGKVVVPYVKGIGRRWGCGSRILSVSRRCPVLAEEEDRKRRGRRPTGVGGRDYRRASRLWPPRRALVGGRQGLWSVAATRLCRAAMAQLRRTAAPAPAHRRGPTLVRRRSLTMTSQEHETLRRR
jgi:hypothetical protein